jgi:hypothetical protein
MAHAMNQPSSWKPPPIFPNRAKTAATMRPGNAPSISGTSSLTHKLEDAVANRVRSNRYPKVASR